MFKVFEQLEIFNDKNEWQAIFDWFFLWFGFEVADKADNRLKIKKI